jgi:putative alpha-1,2-mannosidase
MIFRKALLLALFGCTLMAGCDGSNEETARKQSPATFTEKKNDLVAGAGEPSVSPSRGEGAALSPSGATTAPPTGPEPKQTAKDAVATVRKPVDQDLADYVNTLRGSHSNAYIEDGFSRGLTFPATAVPFGFNMWTPVNRSEPDNAWSTGWSAEKPFDGYYANDFFYQFYEDEGSTKLLDTIQAFAVVHEPSTWIGNRQTLQIMPVSKLDASGNPLTRKIARAEKYQHKNEIARAHYYSVTFDNGTRTEITPTDHAAYTPTYMSPYTSRPELKKGKIWVNNGFWDTYRTAWPLYTLLFPQQTGEMIDGFINGYKDGGWVTRWSGPGYADSMVATSSDIIFADAYLKGVRNFDVSAAYASMVRNGSTFSSSSSQGRKGMDRAPFYGYSLQNGEAASWSLEGYLNDFGIAQMARELGKTDDFAYFSNSAVSYANIFDGNSTGAWSGGWLRAKTQNGEWTKDNSAPDRWCGDYTEGDAWSYAFLAPQDAEGLANLYGGRQQLKEKLDAFFTAPTYRGPGCGWGEGTPEIRTADDLNRMFKLGQYQHSNQPVHHTIYMYNYAGSPASGQNYLRTVMDNLYLTGYDSAGNANGEGYYGDEDNGEQSSWYVFSAMGFYPVSMGRPEYAIGAPYFPKMTVQLRNTKGELRKLVINAPNVSSGNRYVQSVKLNGRAVTRNYLLHSELADGATLDFEMGPNPSQWGTGANDVPTSITQGDMKPAPAKSLLPRGSYEVTSSTAADAAKLFDRTSSTEWQSPAGAAVWIEADGKGTKALDTVKFYTLTSSARSGRDPTGWVLKGSNDGTTWVTLDTRTDQAFAWRQQTRPYALATPASFARYRLEFTGTAALSVAEFELYGVADAAPGPAG